MSPEIDFPSFAVSPPQHKAASGLPSRKRLRKPEREKVAAASLSSGVPASAVVLQLQAIYGVEERTAWRDLAAAKKLLLDWNGGTLEELRAESAAFYRALLCSSSASLRDKLRARAQLDKLLGLQAPSLTAEQVIEQERLRLTEARSRRGKHLEKVLSEMSTDELEIFADFQEKMRVAVAADSDEEGLK